MLFCKDTLGQPSAATRTVVMSFEAYISKVKRTVSEVRLKRGCKSSRTEQLLEQTKFSVRPLRATLRVAGSKSGGSVPARRGPWAGEPAAARRWSRVDLFGDDGDDDVLIPTPHHQPQAVVPLDGTADVTGRGDALPIDADDDITLLQAPSGTRNELRKRHSLPPLFYH